MKKDCTQEREKVIQINEGAIKDHLGKLARSTVEENLNGMLDAVRETSVQLRQMKIAHNLNPEFEVKWTKVSQ